MDKLIFVLGAILVGVCGTLQGPLNVKLGQSLGSQYWAAVASFFITFFVGTIVIAILAMAWGLKLPSFEVIRSATWWHYLGGAIGVFYVLGLILVIPHLGVGLTTVFLLFGQLVSAMIIDHFGFFGYEVREFNLTRLAAVVFMGAAIYLVNKK